MRQTRLKPGSIALACVALAISAALAPAHDFWIIAVGDRIHGISGSNFPASENAVNPSRLAEAVAVSAAGRRPLEVVGTGVANGKDSVLVPLADPAGVAPGDTLTATVRFDGAPAAGLTVHAGYAGQPGGAHAQTHVSDSSGRVAAPITQSGLWYLRTIHMREINEPPFEWESFWASLTFRVP